MKIRVIIEEDYGRTLAEICVPVDPMVRAETMRPLSLSDGPLAFFDTPTAVVRRVTVGRSEYAKHLGPEIAKALVDAMGLNDKINGYTKKERNGQ